LLFVNDSGDVATAGGKPLAAMKPNPPIPLK
jgi:hypothetical protein